MSRFWDDNAIFFVCVFFFFFLSFKSGVLGKRIYVEKLNFSIMSTLEKPGFTGLLKGLGGVICDATSITS